MQKTFNDLVSDYKTLSRDSSTANETLGKSLINSFVKKVLVARDWVFNRSSYEEASVADQQAYPKPYNCERIRAIKVYAGSYYYFPTEIKDREKWTKLNRTTVSSDSAQYFFIENDTIELYPIPAASGNTITIYFQKLVKTLSVDDYEIGTVSVTTPYTTSVVGSSSPVTAFVSAMVGRHIIPTDDGYSYEIESVESSTAFTTVREVRMILSGSAYKIAEMIPFPFGFEDLPLFGALMVYFQSKENPTQAQHYKQLYEEGIVNLLRRDAKSTGNVFEKSDLEEITDINKYPDSIS